MNNKGFTLIELLSVIVIIALVSGIGVISFSSLTTKSNEDYYTGLASNLEFGASNYYGNYRSKRPAIGEVCSKVSLQELLQEKYIDSALDAKGNSCDLNNSYVYIKRNANKQYEYKASFVCGDYQNVVDEIDYCTVLEVEDTTILLSAVDTDNNNYTVTNSYANTSWTNKNITVHFDSEKAVTKYIITNTTTADVFNCSATDNKCSIEFIENGVYNVVSYNEDKEVSERNFNIKIDKNKPTFSLLNENDLSIPNGSTTIKYQNELTNINDLSGIMRINFIISKNNSDIVNNTITGTTILVNNLASGSYKIRVKAYDRALNESDFVETEFNVTRTIQLIDTMDTTYSGTHQVIDGTNYNSLGVNLPTLTKTGKNFLGWYTTSAGGSKISNTTLVSNVTMALYARWE